MRSRSRFTIALPAVLTLLSFPANSQPSDPPGLSGQDWLYLQMAGSLRNGARRQDVEQAMLRLFRQSEIPGGGVTADSVRLTLERMRAQQRAAIVQQRLGLDLDNDGSVSRDELIAQFTLRAGEPLQSNGIMLAPTDDQKKSVLDNLLAEALKDDTNGDGRIDFAEMRAAATSQLARRRPDVAIASTVPMTLDADKDGTVTRAEFLAAFGTAFDSVDTDRDGTVSASELAGAAAQTAEVQRRLAVDQHKQRQLAQREHRSQTCHLPQLGPAPLVVLSSYEGGGLSTSSLGGDDQEVTVSDLVIEPGEDRLQLVLISHDAQIWRLRGAVERIERVIANSGAATRQADGPPRVGIVGIDKDKVFFPQATGCLKYFSAHPSPDSAMSLTELTALLKRAPDTVHARYKFATVALPSGTYDDKSTLNGRIALPSAGPAIRLWQEMLRFNPAGLIQIDPATVVSPVPVRTFETLPQQAGLARLVEDGTLRIITGTSDGSAPQRFNRAGYLAIQGKMRYPAGLHGAHSVRFFLGQDVPRPDGDPGHSCVLTETKDGELVGNGPTCR